MLRRLLECCLEQITNDRHVITNMAAHINRDRASKEPEDCWCYDEQDGAPDAKPGKCLACWLREAIAKQE